MWRAGMVKAKWIGRNQGGRGRFAARRRSTGLVYWRPTDSDARLGFITHSADTNTGLIYC